MPYRKAKEGGDVGASSTDDNAARGCFPRPAAGHPVSRGSIQWHAWWFDLLLVAILALSLGLVIAQPPVPWALLITGLVVFLVGYGLVRPRASALAYELPSVWSDYLSAVCLIAGVGLASLANNDCSMWLCVACPMLCFAIRVPRRAIIWNIVGVGIAGVASAMSSLLHGTLARDWPYEVIGTLAVIAFSTMIGSMMTAVIRWGKERADLLEELQASQADLAESYQQLLQDTHPTPVSESPLSARETEVLALVSQGCTNREIGNRLFISPATVKTHMEHILTKLGATTRTQAVLVAHQEGLLD